MQNENKFGLCLESGEFVPSRELNNGATPESNATLFSINEELKQATSKLNILSNTITTRVTFTDEELLNAFNSGETVIDGLHEVARLFIK